MTFSLFLLILGGFFFSQMHMLFYIHLCSVISFLAGLHTQFHTEHIPQMCS